MVNKKLERAIWALSNICNGNEYHRMALRVQIECQSISPDDPWVAAALGCSRDEDIPDIALEFFLADVKSGYFDTKVENDNSNPDPLSSP